jgi:protein-S-isoprenylcysteine O-methyltransferase Ste14
VRRSFPAAVLAFLLLPGSVAFAVPLLLLAPTTAEPFTISGTALVAVGTVLLLWCVRNFYVAGKGTLAPWAPPQHLVTTGPYRVSRNPMYVAVLIILCGWAIGFRSLALTSYAVVVAIAFHLRVAFGEEPWLAHRYGEQWLRYKATVPRWFGL